MQTDSQHFDDRSPALKLFDTLATLARQAGLEHDPRIVRVLRMIAANPGDWQSIREMARPAMNLIKRHPLFLARQGDDNPFQPYPGGIADGPMRLGHVYDPWSPSPPAFGLFPHELNQNLLVFGRAGSGKTVLLMLILANLMRQKLPFWVMDFKKDYRHLLRPAPSLLVFDWRNFKFNPLVPPPGTDPIYWMQIFVEIFFQVFFPSPAAASKSALLEALERLYAATRAQFGDGVYPSMHDLETALHGNRPGIAGHADGQRERLRACHSRLRPLLALLGSMFDCQAGYSIEELLHQPVVLELDGLTHENQAFLVNLLFYWIFTFRLNSARRGRLLHALVFDEAKMVFAREQASGTSVISRLVSTAREMGQGLVVADQMPSTLGHAILANVYAMIGLSLSATKDIHEMSYAMNLGAEQRSSMSHLGLGTGIVKLADRYTRPFLVEFPDFPLKKDVADGELARHMAPHLARLNFKPRIARREATAARDASSAVMGGIEKVAAASQTAIKGGGAVPETPQAATAAPPVTAPPVPSAARPFDLSDKEFMLLMDIRNRPFRSIVERAQELKLNNYMANKLYRRLREKGLVSELEIKLGRRGRAAKFLVLAQTAEARIGRQNLGPGKGGFEHVYHQQRLQKLFEKRGYRARIEEYRNGKSVDLGLTQNEVSIALELAMSPPGETSNIEKDFRAGWNQVWTVCRDEKIRSCVERAWRAQHPAFPDGLVRFHLISDPFFDSEGK